MAKRNSEFRFKELGDLLIHWRSDCHRSALALFKTAKFSFGYNSYAAFENGSSLPSIEQLLEIAKCFRKDANDAILIWAKVQMPNAELENLFLSRTPKKIRHISSTKKPSMENTWVLGPADMEHLLKYPWLTNINLILTMARPDEIKFKDINFHGLSQIQYIKKYLKIWIDSGRILKSKTGIKLNSEHIFIPENKLGKKIRANNLKMAFKSITENLSNAEISQNLGSRIINTRTLSQGQLNRWAQKLQSVGNDFSNEPFEVTNSLENMYVLVIGLAKRNTD